MGIKMELSQLSLQSPTLKEDLKEILHASQLTIETNGVNFLKLTNYHIRFVHKNEPYHYVVSSDEQLHDYTKTTIHCLEILSKLQGALANSPYRLKLDHENYMAHGKLYFFDQNILQQDWRYIATHDNKTLTIQIIKRENTYYTVIAYQETNQQSATHHQYNLSITNEINIKTTTLDKLYPQITNYTNELTQDLEEIKRRGTYD
jgi:hypothetical protein